MKKLYSTENRVDLYLFKSILEDQGVRCMIKNEQPPLAGEIPPIIAWPELWVIDDQEYNRALSILQVESVKVSGINKSWECPRCHEHLEKQFDICWKCGCSRESLG